MTDQEKLDFLNTAVLKLFKKPLRLDLGIDTPLVDLGLDSLDIVELQMYYEEETGHETGTDSRLTSLRDLMDLMK